MMKKTVYSIGAAFAILFFVSAADVLAQRGSRGGRPTNTGRPVNTGSPAGIGVDRGLGTSSQRSRGRSDRGLNNASNRSAGRSDQGLSRAQMASIRANSVSDRDLGRYFGLSKRFGTTPEELRDRFELALLDNPDLKFGHFVAAHVVADNLGGRFPLITTENILGGLANGDSFGETLRDLGLTKEQAKTARALAKDKMKEAENRRP